MYLEDCQASVLQLLQPFCLSVCLSVCLSLSLCLCLSLSLSLVSCFFLVLQMVSLYYDPDGKKVFSYETKTSSQVPPTDSTVKKAVTAMYGAKYENTEDPQVRWKETGFLPTYIEKSQGKLERRVLHCLIDIDNQGGFVLCKVGV